MTERAPALSLPRAAATPADAVAVGPAAHPRPCAAAPAIAFEPAARLLAAPLAAWLSWGCQGPPTAPRDAGPDAPDGSPGTPDLAIDPGRTRADLAIEERVFEPDACELHPDEDCIGAAGLRRLLRFAIETPNVGTGDLALGAPDPDNELFVWSECHGHYHFRGYAAYELVDPAGEIVVRGHKQAFCLVDTHPYVDDPGVPEQARYSCGFQGIQRGWSDVYDSGLACQFIDVSGVPDGDYVLRVQVNAAGALPELTDDNNRLELAVALGDPALATPTEPCAFADPHALEQVGRECGWRDEGTVACMPGEQIRIGCAAGCDLGSCIGDPMLRVCDAARGDGNCSFAAALGRSDDACGGSCPAVVGMACPASGQLAVYTAPKSPGAAYSCEIALREL